MTNISSNAVTAEAEGPLVPTDPTPGPKAKAKPAWMNLNFGPRLWVSLGIIVVIALLAFVGPLFYPYGPDEKVGSLYDAPSAAHWLGTENFGYDVVAVLIASTRNSLINGLLALLGEIESDAIAVHEERCISVLNRNADFVGYLPLDGFSAITLHQKEKP